jgi:RNA polymerase sigma-70 factor (ECF subfamily)
MIKKKSRNDQVQGWYNQHGPALVAYLCSVLGDRTSAEDVLQQVFLKLLKGNVEVTGEAVKAYLFRAVRNTALNLARRNSRNTSLDTNRRETEGAEQQWFEAPVELGYWSTKLENAVRGLPAEQREILVMRIWGEMTFDEIATVLDVSINTVTSRYRYAIGKLREMLQHFEVQNEPAAK